MPVLVLMEILNIQLKTAVCTASENRDLQVLCCHINGSGQQCLSSRPVNSVTSIHSINLIF